MKAIRLRARGGPEQLVYEEVREPSPGTSHALVRVLATGITPAELSWDETYRTCDGLERIPSVPGHELCGVVERLGPGVVDMRIGEEVYALTEFCRDGTAAEFVVVRASDLAPKPRSLDYVQSAAVPLSGLTAWQGLFHHGGLQKRQRVLIHGAAGGVGTFAVQLARWRNTHVAVTASSEDADFLRELGADDVIDYARDRFDERLRDFDLVLDVVGGETLERSFTVLKRGGILVSIAQPPSAEKAKAHGVRALFFIVEPSRNDLIEIARVIDAGHLKPIVAAVFPIASARQAFERGLAGHNRGKLVLTVTDQARGSVWTEQP